MHVNKWFWRHLFDQITELGLRVQGCKNLNEDQNAQPPAFWGLRPRSELGFVRVRSTNDPASLSLTLPLSRRETKCFPSSGRSVDVTYIFHYDREAYQMWKEYQNSNQQYILLHWVLCWPYRRAPDGKSNCAAILDPSSELSLQLLDDSFQL